MCQSVLGCCDKAPENNLEEERVTLAHGFRGFGPGQLAPLPLAMERQKHQNVMASKHKELGPKGKGKGQDAVPKITPHDWSLQQGPVSITTP